MGSVLKQFDLASLGQKLRAEPMPQTFCRDKSGTREMGQLEGKILGIRYPKFCMRKGNGEFVMDEQLKDILSRVQRPGRYIGGELNSVRKEWTEGMTSAVLAYPDTYEVGMSYLGLRILYHLLNERDGVVCERVFAPWADMEQELRAGGRKLFSLETRRDLSGFDIVGFSLVYELTYTNVLNMLDLGGITVRSEERREGEPLVIAGGACCYNPEPMSDFIDVFLVGDGEEALPRFIDRYRDLKAKRSTRKEMLRGLSGLDGIYVPSLHEAEYEGERFRGLRSAESGVPVSVNRALVKDLENAYYPAKQIVPYIRIVHDRISVEIMRGCPNMCRFCQASSVNRPLRLRSVERVREICRETYKNTGYERMALLSLSSVNYPYLSELVTTLNRDFRDKGVGISIPSLRVDEAFYEMPGMIATIRKAGLTFAPETASASIRKAIRKDIDEGILCKSALMAYRHGWNRIKLYFMVGFPDEAEEEAGKIIALAGELSRLRKEVSKGSAEIRVSVNPFVPRPHTPFQWLGMRSREYLTRVRNLLVSRAPKKVTIDFHDIDQSILEACLAKGGRRTGAIIFRAWEEGAKMDGWNEFFDFPKWEKAFGDSGIDMGSFATKAFSPDDKLPWDHIRVSSGGEDLVRELERSGFWRE